MKKLLILLFLLLLQLNFYADDENSESRIYVEYYKNTGIYKIVTKLEFFGEGFFGCKFFRKWLVKYWCKQIEEYWNANSVYFTVFEKGKKSRRVKLIFEIISKVRDENEKPSLDYYQVNVVNVIKEMWKKLKGEDTMLIDGYRSWAMREAKEGEVSLCFANFIWGAVAAHELGHIWGLPDEYVKTNSLWEKFVNGFLKEFPPSIMNVTWFFLSEPKAKHYRKIYRNIKKFNWQVINR